MLVSVIIITRNRHDELVMCVESVLQQDYSSFEIILVDNASEKDTANLIAKFDDPRIKSFPSKSNLGVSGGRNRGFRKSSGDIFIIVDDDVEIIDRRLISKVVKKFASDNSIGALAFRIIDYNTGRVKRTFFPARRKSLPKDVEFETSWFIGAGHAITRVAFEATGYYRGFRPYGSEEFDYSLRLLDNGFRIFYFPSASVLHLETPNGRMPNTQQLAISLAHRIKAALLNLPALNVISFILLRTIIEIVRSRFNILSIFQAARILILDLPRIFRRRKVIKKSTFRRIKALRGNIYY